MYLHIIAACLNMSRIRHQVTEDGGFSLSCTLVMPAGTYQFGFCTQTSPTWINGTVVVLPNGFVNGMDAPSLTGLSGEIVGVSLSRESTMTIKTIGLDLAKQVFQIHAVDERGQVVMKNSLRVQNWLLSLPTSHLAWSVWRLVRVLISGLTSLPGLDMMFA